MSEANDMIPSGNWLQLRQFTAARVALGRSGVSLPTTEWLSFKADHAMARDAIYTPMDKTGICEQLQQAAIPFVELKTNAADRKEYLLRPDKGRQLHPDSAALLKAFHEPDAMVCITLADGLSPLAVNRYGVPLIKLLREQFIAAGLKCTPVCMVEQGRVAVSDETGSLTGARLSIILIGERPGLSSPDSLGVYLTYDPCIGKTDEARNCISNIRSGGLDLETAATRIFYLVTQALKLKVSGLLVK